eukprot:2033323-Pleurochrysis_carterae.AAC.2
MPCPPRSPAPRVDAPPPSLACAPCRCPAPLARVRPVSMPCPTLLLATVSIPPRASPTRVPGTSLTCARACVQLHQTCVVCVVHSAACEVKA